MLPLLLAQYTYIPIGKTNVCRAQPQKRDAGAYYKKAVKPTAVRREWVSALIKRYNTSIRLACQSACLSQSAYYYRSIRESDETLESALLALVEKHNRWGFPKCRQRLKAMGYRWNHKRIYRVYRQLKLHLRPKKRKRLPPREARPLVVPSAVNTCWSIDFMSDSLIQGRRIRTLNVVDDYNREVLGIEIDFSLPSSRVIRSLNQIIAWRGQPDAIRVDNGPEFISQTFALWAESLGIELLHIEPGSPYQNGFIERFNRTYREDVLDMYWFSSLKDLRQATEDWMVLYNEEQPHESLGHMTPTDYVKAA